MSGIFTELTLNLKHNGPAPWVGLVTGESPKYGWALEFMKHQVAAVRGTGIAHFTLPDAYGYYDICFGDRASRAFYEVRPAYVDKYEPFCMPAAYREVERPYGKPLGDWKSLGQVIVPRAVWRLEDDEGWGLG